MKKRPADAVDAILAQWQRERPDLATHVMGPIGRLNRCMTLIQRRLEKIFSTFGMTFWEFDVLATLRRSGTPYCLTPTCLFSTMMISSGTMTHRLQRLEASGWVQRIANQQDARSMLVQLTPEGLALIDRAVEAHVDNEHDILSLLPAEAVESLDTSLSLWLSALEETPTESHTERNDKK
ncbi:MarR family transcriptional regulator [Chania multitudinisentens RB-25]|uniref:MarR family transcriptional regulator n=1 Tax=Chania multitudinisentens RB-25 TaxID=1441930 RepID=W0L3X1_9GAMM|nr:MarR family transcriptional regulator [Chania multitudinisentens]AHG18371.1 MarR family transcriptional regulator [Chania multitudinisentens RB-25]